MSVSRGEGRFGNSQRSAHLAKNSLRRLVRPRATQVAMHCNPHLSSILLYIEDLVDH